MEEKISKAKYLTITLAVCLVLVFNFLRWKSETIGLFFGLAYLLFYGFVFGSIFVKKKGWEIIFGLVFLFSAISILGAVVIYFHQFNDYAFVVLMLLIPAFLMIPYYRLGFKEKFSIKKTLRKYLDKFDERREPKINGLLVIIYLALSAICFFLLYRGQTEESLQSHWRALSGFFFFFYFLATAVLLIYLFNSHRTKLPLTLLIIYFFLSSGVAALVYKIGFGFDPFIHEATEIIIAQTGGINPTPLYYLGQYALVIFLAKLTFIDLALINRLLVPVLFSLTLPAITFYVFGQWLKKNYALVLALAILTIPYSGFIMTAPQNLANLIFIITILLSLLYFKDQMPVSILYLLTLATLAIHPLAGIPLLITIALLNLFKLLYKSYIKYLSLYFLTALLFILFLPLAFLANGSGVNPAPSFQLSDLSWLGWTDKFDLALNLVYLIKLNKIILAGLIVATGLIYVARSRLLKNNAGYLIAALVIFADFIITKYFLTFSDLRSYDQHDFVNRLATLAFYVLLPFFLIGVYFMIKKFWNGDFYAKAFAVFILTGTLTASLYLSYPRLNQYEPAKFFSISSADIKAVNLIESTAEPDHVVLANQMVGAAAIKEFGFKKYYNKEFYYSMPMGSPRTFYDYYLAMIYEGATRKTMEQLMAQAGVDEAYFVLNSYWNNFEKITNQASESADKVYAVDDGKIYIFKYAK